MWEDEVWRCDVRDTYQAGLWKSDKKGPRSRVAKSLLSWIME